jgi:hypothetical protein
MPSSTPSTGAVLLLLILQRKKEEDGDAAYFDEELYRYQRGRDKNRLPKKRDGVNWVIVVGYVIIAVFVSVFTAGMLLL